MEKLLSGLLPESLLIDLPEVDAQHEAIFVCIEALKEACFENDELPVAELRHLLGLFGEHFATEERFARDAGMEFSHHGRSHGATLRMLEKTLSDAEKGISRLHELLRYMEFWFERHIIEEDRPLAVSLALRRSRSASGVSLCGGAAG